MMYEEVDALILVFLTLALDGGEWSASRPCRTNPQPRSDGTQWRVGWVDPRAGLDDMEKWTFLNLPDSKSDHSVVQLEASRCTDYTAEVRVYEHRSYQNGQIFQMVLKEKWRVIEDGSIDVDQTLEELK
jgi:hypothetical protein